MRLNQIKLRNYSFIYERTVEKQRNKGFWVNEMNSLLFSALSLYMEYAAIFSFTNSWVQLTHKNNSIILIVGGCELCLPEWVCVHKSVGNLVHFFIFVLFNGTDTTNALSFTNWYAFELNFIPLNWNKCKFESKTGNHRMYSTRKNQVQSENQFRLYR